jgi:hypothetical protein
VTTDELSAILGAAVVSADPGLAKRLSSDARAYLDLVSLTARAHDETRNMLTAAVNAARAAGHSWEAVGQTLGMSRQAAQQRFGAVDKADDEGRARTKRLFPVNAFTEMAALKRAGRHGWHSIGFGANFHLVAKSPYQWEHVRVLVRSSRILRLEEEGWQRIGDAWFPWAYYKRRLDQPAVPGDD